MHEKRFCYKYVFRVRGKLCFISGSPARAKGHSQPCHRPATTLAHRVAPAGATICKASFYVGGSTCFVRSGSFAYTGAPVERAHHRFFSGCAKLMSVSPAREAIFWGWPGFGLTSTCPSHGHRASHRASPTPEVVAGGPVHCGGDDFTMGQSRRGRQVSGF